LAIGYNNPCIELLRMLACVFCVVLWWHWVILLCISNSPLDMFLS
jgi:hypothetical protein